MNIPHHYSGYNMFWHPVKLRVIDAEGRFYHWRQVTPYLNNLFKCEP